MDTVTIEEFTTSGEVFINAEGIVTEEPIQLFKTENAVIFRIGNNTYWFYPDSKIVQHRVYSYDGPEYHVDGNKLYTVGSQRVPAEFLVSELLPEMLEKSQENRGELPEKSYFAEGTPGYQAERS